MSKHRNKYCLIFVLNSNNTSSKSVCTYEGKTEQYGLHKAGCRTFLTTVILGVTMELLTCEPVPAIVKGLLLASV